MICGGCGCGPGRSCGRTRQRGDLRAEGLRRREPCCSCAHKVRCCLRSIGRAAQTARDGGRPLTVVRQRVGLAYLRRQSTSFPTRYRMGVLSSPTGGAARGHKPTAGFADRRAGQACSVLVHGCKKSCQPATLRKFPALRMPRIDGGISWPWAA